MECQKVLMAEMAKPDKGKPFITKLIVQGALMLLEADVAIQCRECDVALVQSCLQPAADEYAKVIKAETGAAKQCKFTIDKAKFLPPPPKPGSDVKSCLGGVVLSCQNDSIVIDNTV